MAKEFKYEFVDRDTFDFLIDEKQNTYISLRKVKWGDSAEPRVDLRKYITTANGERMSKGVSFMTDEGPHELANVLVEQGYGDTRRILDALATRNNLKVVTKEVDDEEYFDIESIIDQVG
jgi:hypothetical protein